MGNYDDSVLSEKEAKAALAKSPSVIKYSKHTSADGEIKTELLKLEEGILYMPGPDELVITEEHTIADIVRCALHFAQNDKTEIQAILNAE